MAPKEESISKRRLRSRVPCSPLLYSYSHNIAYMGVCCMPVYWCSCCVTCHVIYRFGDGGGGQNLESFTFVTLIEIPLSSSSSSVIVVSLVVSSTIKKLSFFECFFCFPALNSNQFNNVTLGHYVNGNGITSLNQVHILDQFDLFHFLVAFIYLLPNSCLIHFFADIDARHWDFHNVAVRQ